MFSNLTYKRLSKTCYYWKAQRVARNQVVYKEGDEAQYIYIVENGDFKLTKTLTGTQKQVEIAIVGAGEMLGEGKNSAMDNTCM